MDRQSDGAGRVEPAIAWPYGQLGRDEPISVYAGEGRLTQGTRETSGTLEISLRWLPSLRIAFETTSSIPIELGYCQLALLDVPTLTPTYDAHITGTNTGTGGGVQISGTTGIAFATKDALQLDRLVFHLPNWDVIIGDIIEGAGGGSWRGRVDLVDEAWRIRLEARPDGREVIEGLRAFGGNALTHIGEITRLNKTRFDPFDAEDLLRALARFFSMARGIWTSPLLLVGYEGEEIVYREAKALHTQSWRGNYGWFSVRTPEELVAAFPHFITRWRDTALRDTLDLANSWLIEANTTKFAETSIVLVQTALEMLAWQILVKQEKLISGKKFGDRTAETNIRSLLKWAHVPVEIPAEREQLLALAAERKWNDGPHALTSFRNRLIHSRGGAARIFGTPVSARQELREVAIWYLELVLLRLTGFNGRYVNRNRAVYVGDVEPVPWA